MSDRIARRRGLSLFEFFSDKDYYQRLYKIALPIILQQFIMSSLNMVGLVMIGQLGAVPVAAVGLANQIFFLLNLILFGVYTGSAMFTAQLWGVRDILQYSQSPWSGTNFGNPCGYVLHDNC